MKAALLAALVALLPACSGFRSTDLGAGREAGGADARSGGEQRSSGPGPWGALPTGYCCTSDLECRYRRCASIGGDKMCLDLCFDASSCQGSLPGFRCVQDDAGLRGYCEPEQAGMRCVPAASFQRGQKKLGACCVATHDGRAGEECEGNHCASFTPESPPDNPYICTNACDAASDCPGNFICSPTGDGYSICMATDPVYTCH